MNDALITALAAALFHFLWQGGALALLLAIALGLFRSPRVKYALGCAALFAMPAVFAVTAVILYPRTPVLPGALHFPPAAPALFFAAPSAAPGESLLIRVQEFMRAFVPFWFAGIALVYLRSAVSWTAVRSLRRTAAPAVSAEWRGRIASFSQALGIARAVELLESSRVDVPVVAGILRPVILVPAGCLANMPADQLEYLLIHELAHIRRFDYPVNLLQKAVEGLLFYHPAVWWVSNTIRRERENCCDDAVLELRPEPRGYASALAGLEQTRWAAAPAANGGDLLCRIRRILREPSPSHVAHAPALAALLIVFTAVVALAALPKARPKPIPAALPLPILRHRTPALFQVVQQAEAPQPGTPWEKWVNEDVAYIITDQERRAYKALTADAEREKFIEQFWLVRDPTPGTPENEMKEEHYRRISYVNTRFADPHLPGWKTDRGRIYITFGPPDEIDSHPSCSAAAPALDSWKYRWIEGIGNNVRIDFADSACTGEYRMTMDPAEVDAVRVSKPADTGVINIAVSPGAANVVLPVLRGKTRINFQVTAADGTNAASLQDEVEGPKAYKANFRLAPGAYTVTITSTNVDFGIPETKIYPIKVP